MSPGIRGGLTTYVTMDVTFPGESTEYRAARDRLLEREIELRRAMEAGPDGTPAAVRLSQLFTRGRDSLVIYSCPSRAAPTTATMRRSTTRRTPVTSARSSRSGTCST